MDACLYFEIVARALDRLVPGVIITWWDPVQYSMHVGFLYEDNVRTTRMFMMCQFGCVVNCIGLVWVSNDRQHIMGLPVMMIVGFCRTSNSMVYAKITDLYKFGLPSSVIPFVLYGLMPCARLLWMNWVVTSRCTWISLYVHRGKIHNYSPSRVPDKVLVLYKSASILSD